MAKSMRSKSKRAFRSKKRETGVYAATEAARLHRLNSKLVATVTKDKDGDISLEDAKGDDTLVSKPTVETQSQGDEIDLGENQSTTQSQQISTHGPRGSRNEEWRKSKGMAPRTKARGLNQQGGIAAKRKSGRSARRR